MTSQTPTTAAGAVKDFKASELKLYARGLKKLNSWRSLIDAANTYALPAFNPTHQADGGAEDPAAALRIRFEFEASDAVREKGHRMHFKIFPIGQRWAGFAPGALPNGQGLTDKQAEGLKSEMEEVGERFHGAIETSNFHSEIAPAFEEVQISYAALMIHEGTLDNPLRFEAIPASTVVPMESRDGVIRTVFRREKMTWEKIEERFKRVAGDKFKEPQNSQVVTNLKSHPGDETAVIECVIHKPDNDPAKRYQYAVFLEDDESQLVDAFLKSSPFVVFRMGKAPGENVGWGSVLSVVPKIKVLNAVRELWLQHLAIGISGIWQADDDGVLNPQNIVLKPGTIIPKAVGSAGLTPLSTGINVELTIQAIQEMEEQVRRAILGPSMPPVDAGVRSAYENAARLAEGQEVELPATLRILTECHEPIVERCLHILSRDHMQGSPFYIGPVEVEDSQLEVVPLSPLIRVMKEAEANRKVNAYATGLNLNPERTQRITKADNILRDIMEGMGLEPDMFHDEDTVKANDQAEQEAQRMVVEAQLASAQGGGQGQPGPQ